MTDLPGGTLTFLFTDIEGSTRLLHELGSDYDTLLETHRSLLRDAFQNHDGLEVGTEGDSFFVVFERVSDGVAAVLEAQLSLLKHPWEKGREVRVRMGLHSGEARLKEGNYTGLAVHQASRISSVAHGGQVLLSGSVKELAEGELPPDLRFKDLGNHRLKDMPLPQRLFQLCHPDLPEEFPPLRSPSDKRNNLPSLLTSFVGREAELKELATLLETSRIVTITGAGGSGKTRLALEVAKLLLERFEDGVWVVDLSTVTDPELVPRHFASSLGIKDQETRSLDQSLNDFLADKNILFVLDNCEHLVSASARLAHQILGVSPRTRLLVTTREALRVPGEVAWRIPSLAIPDETNINAESVDQYAGTRLFLDRVAAVDPSFRLDPSEVPFLVQICRRLDGIPLAIELAAARTTSLSVSEIAERLDDRFQLLTGGSNTALPRQQTLRALVDWSYELLSEPEREVLIKSSVFSGGFTLRAAEHVCAGEGSLQVLDQLSALVAKSLLLFVRTGGVGRYRLLETIRDYAREKLLASEWAEEVRVAHLDFFVGLAEEFEPRLSRADQKLLMDQLEADHDNIRAALEWSTSRGPDDRALRMVNAIWRFWWVRGHWGEARRWLDKILISTPDETSLARGKALWAAAFFARFQGEYQAACDIAKQSLDVLRAAGSEPPTAYPLFVLGHANVNLGRGKDARRYLEESREVARRSRDPQVLAWALLVLGSLEMESQGHESAAQNWAEALETARAVGDSWSEATAYNNLAMLLYTQGQDEESRSKSLEALRIRRELGDKYGMAVSLFNLGSLAWIRGDSSEASEYFEGAVDIARETGDKQVLARSLEGLAFTSLQSGDHERAAELVNEALDQVRSTNSAAEIADALNIAAWTWHLYGVNEKALEWAEEAARIAGSVEAPRNYRMLLHTLAEIWRATGDLERAAAALKEGLELAGADPTLTDLLESAGGLLSARGAKVPAVQLMAAAARLIEERGLTTRSHALERERATVLKDLDEARAALGIAFDDAWQEGEKLSLDEAVALALKLI